jgi:hypothetical protein
MIAFLMLYKILFEKKCHLFSGRLFDGWNTHEHDDYISRSVGKN